MPNPPPAIERPVALFLLGMLLLNYPLLPLFNGDGTLLGIPALYAYIFAAWLGLIALLAATIGRGRS
jgi:hypothetical protein